MKKEIQEYAEAVQENINASHNELLAKDLKRKAYYRLMKAKEALKLKESELLDINSPRL